MMVMIDDADVAGGGGGGEGGGGTGGSPEGDPGVVPIVEPEDAEAVAITENLNTMFT